MHSKQGGPGIDPCQPERWLLITTVAKWPYRPIWRQDTTIYGYTIPHIWRYDTTLYGGTISPHMPIRYHPIWRYDTEKVIGTVSDAKQKKTFKKKS